MRYYFSLIQKTRERYLNCFCDIGRVLMFHHVFDNVEKWDDNDFIITEKSLEKMLVKLIENKCIFKKISDIENSNSQCRYITFDDGYEDVYTKAFPILKRLNIPFAVFVTTDYIDTKDHLNIDMLKCLAAEALCTIGSHTKSHPFLRHESADNARYEILQSKHILERLIQEPVDYFAFPYGSVYACSKRDIDLVKECGYSLSFSALRTHISQKALQNKFFIPRINVNEKNFMNIGE